MLDAELVPGNEAPARRGRCRGNSHEVAVKYLTAVYQRAKSGFGNDHVCSSGASLDYGNLQYGEVVYSGMAPLYTALQLGGDDVFYDLGSGTGKLVLYVALRGEVGSAQGLEVGERRHAQAEEACARLRRELGAARTGESRGLPQLDMPCASFSVALGDIRQSLYQDATVVVLANLCMDMGVQNRTLDNLMRCPSLRRLACIVPFAPHPRLVPTRTVMVSCTWAKVSAWHIYDVLAANPRGRVGRSAGPQPPAPLGKPQAPSKGRPRSRSAVHASVPPTLSRSGAAAPEAGLARRAHSQLPALVASQRGDVAATAPCSRGTSSGRNASGARGSGGNRAGSRGASCQGSQSCQDRGAATPLQLRRRACGAAAEGGAGEASAEQAALGSQFRCIAPRGVGIRASPNLEDRLDRAQTSQSGMTYVSEGTIVCALECRDGWLRTPLGWLPLRMRGEPAFEVLPSPRRGLPPLPSLSPLLGLSPLPGLPSLPSLPLPAPGAAPAKCCGAGLGAATGQTSPTASTAPTTAPLSHSPQGSPPATPPDAHPD